LLLELASVIAAQKIMKRVDNTNNFLFVLLFITFVLNNKNGIPYKDKQI
jgi:hypothetical protein